MNTVIPTYTERGESRSARNVSYLHIFLSAAFLREVERSFSTEAGFFLFF